MTTLKISVFAAVASIFLNCTSSRSINTYKLKELSNQTESNKINKILIIGTGGISTRFFLDKLSEELKLKFKNVNVETGYEFLGYKQDLNKQLNSILSKGNFDAVLRFTPTDEAENPIVINNPDSGPGPKLLMSYVRFTQPFVVSLITKSNSTKPLWEASLNTNFDPRQDKFYTRIADDILKHLQHTYN